MSLANDDRTLDQLVEMAAESLEYPNADEAYATEEVRQLASEFDDAVYDALEEVVRRYPPKGDATAEDLFDADGPYNILMTLRGEGVGIWDGRWEEFYDDTEEVERLLKQKLVKWADKLEDAFHNAAYETGGGEEYDEEHADEYAASRHKNVMSMLGWLSKNYPDEYQQLMMGVTPAVPSYAEEDPTSEWWLGDQSERLWKELEEIFLEDFHRKHGDK